MPSEGLVRALESLRIDDRVTTEDIREILGAMKAKSKRTQQTRKVKYMDSKCVAYRRRMQELEHLWMSAERRAQVYAFHLENIRGIAGATRAEADRSPERLLETIKEIEKEVDCLGSENRVSSKNRASSSHELTEMAQYLDGCIKGSFTPIRHKV